MTLAVLADVSWIFSFSTPHIYFPCRRLADLSRTVPSCSSFLIQSLFATNRTNTIVLRDKLKNKYNRSPRQINKSGMIHRLSLCLHFLPFLRFLCRSICTFTCAALIPVALLYIVSILVLHEDAFLSLPFPRLSFSPFPRSFVSVFFFLAFSLLLLLPCNHHFKSPVTRYLLFCRKMPSIIAWCGCSSTRTSPQSLVAPARRTSASPPVAEQTWSKFTFRIGKRRWSRPVPVPRWRGISRRSLPASRTRLSSSCGCVVFFYA